MILRKLALTAAALFAGSIFHLAQAQDLRFGPRLGVNLATFRGDDSEFFTADPETVVGLKLGGFVNYTFSSGFGVGAELLYNRTGARYDFGADEATFRLDYISLPLLAHYRFDAGNIAPRVYLGPSFNFLTSAEFEFEEPNRTTTVEIDDNLTGVDVSFVLGVGLDFPVGGLDLTVDLRYDLGLSPIYDKNLRNGFRSDEFYNSAFGILVGLSFGN